MPMNLTNTRFPYSADPRRRKDCALNRWITGSIAAIVTISGCGNERATPPSPARTAALALLVDQARANGAQLDSLCTASVLSRIPDNDVSSLVDAGPAGDPAISDTAARVGLELFECVRDANVVVVTTAAPVAPSTTPSAPTTTSTTPTTSTTSTSLPDTSLPDTSPPDTSTSAGVVAALVESLEASGNAVDRRCIDDVLATLGEAPRTAAPTNDPVAELIGSVLACTLA